MRPESLPLGEGLHLDSPYGGMMGRANVSPQVALDARLGAVGLVPLDYFLVVRDAAL